MPHRFDADAMAGVLGHMNRDHADDNLVIVRGFGRATAVAAAMTSFDGDGGHWSAHDASGAVTDVDVRWPEGPITERHEVRAAVVAVYDEACRRLGMPSRPHA